MHAGSRHRERVVVRGRIAAGRLALAALLVAPAAAGQPAADHPRTVAEACFAAAEAAQPLVQAGRLRAAQRELVACAREACPRAARTDCRTWLDQVTRTLPTVVFRARKASPGGDVAVADVRVSMEGGAVLAEHLDETPVAVDPGAHTLRFERPGSAPVELSIELRPGESRRVVDVVFAPAAPAAAPAPAASVSPATAPLAPVAAPVEPEPVAPEPAGSPTAAWVLLGSGAVALGVGAYFEASGLSDRGSLAGSCKPTQSCAPSDVDAARARVAVGDVALTAGVALAAIGAYLYFARAPAASSGLRLHVGPLVGGAFGGLEGRL